MKLRSVVLLVVGCGLLPTLAGAVNPPGAPDDHFLCYKAGIAKDTLKFVTVAPVNLTDGRQPVAFEVSKPGLICDPADNQTEGIVNATIKLESYKTKAVSGAHTPETITVVNQINPAGIVVTTKKVDIMLMPSAVDLSVVPPAPPPASHNVDYFKCYSVKIAKGQPKFPAGIQRSVSAQFTPTVKLLDIKKPKHLCAPASKDGSVIKNGGGYLMCYQAKPAKDHPKHTPLTALEVGNDFAQGETLATKKDAELCVPSIINPQCGDNVENQLSEDCDGTDDSACPGECSYLCKCRVQLPFVIDPATSELQVRGVSAAGAGSGNSITIGSGTGSAISGTITINIEGALGATAPGQYAISVPVTTLPPIDVNAPGFGNVATACIFLVEDAGLPGSGLTGTGVLNCFGTPVQGIASPSFGAYEDHCTNGTACDSGALSTMPPNGCPGALGHGGKLDSETGECVPAAAQDMTCTATDALTATTANLEDPTDPHPAVCNSPLYGRFDTSGFWIPGDVVLTLNAAIDLRGPGDPCNGPPTNAPIKGPLTTGKVVAGIMDVFPGTVPFAGKVQATSVTGIPFGCSPFSTTGASLVTAGAVLDITTPFGVADLTTALVLKAQ